MYHDHLIEAIDTKVQLRNDSRSTQQMFEHQFGRKKQKRLFDNH
jgi:hypothetical protein